MVYSNLIYLRKSAEGFNLPKIYINKIRIMVLLNEIPLFVKVSQKIHFFIKNKLKIIEICFSLDALIGFKIGLGARACSSKKVSSEHLYLRALEHLYVICFFSFSFKKSTNFT